MHDRKIVSTSISLICRTLCLPIFNSCRTDLIDFMLRKNLRYFSISKYELQATLVYTAWLEAFNVSSVTIVYGFCYNYRFLVVGNIGDIRYKLHYHFPKNLTVFPNRNVFSKVTDDIIIGFFLVKRIMLLRGLHSRRRYTFKQLFFTILEMDPL